MPELPEVEITARLIGRELRDARLESALAPGINTMRSFEPPLSALAGAAVRDVRRRGKLFVVDLEAASGERLSLLIHLMSAGRLQLFERRAAPRDRSSRLLLRIAGGEHAMGERAGDERELRLREFGTRQAAWAKLLASDQLEAEETVAALGPEAWPRTPAPESLRALLAPARPLYSLLRDQHVLAGIGRSWVDEILHEARLSPFRRGAELDAAEAAALHAAIVAKLGGAVEHYEQTLTLPIPDKLPMPLTVHRRNGMPCPRCGTTLAAVFYEDYVMCYCPDCQTGGQPLKDRRLSRLLR